MSAVCVIWQDPDPEWDRDIARLRGCLISRSIKENWFRVGLLFVLVLFGWIIYQATVIRPQEENKESNLEKQTIIGEEQKREREKISNLNQCLGQADEKQKSDVAWYLNYYEEKFGKNWTNDDVNSMAFNMAVKDIKTETQQQKTECYKRYPQR